MKSCELILALDLESRTEAVALLSNIGTDLKWIKIGLQMFTSHGPDWVKQVADMGYQIFLDLKLHDIPNTVAKAVQSLSHLPIGMLTLHSSGGAEMLAAANKVRLELKPDLLLLGVTVLTSMNKAQLNRIGVSASPKDQVYNLAGAVAESGVPGIVCSAKELETLGPDFGAQLKFVTPGIRPAGASADDQKRIVTPAQAATLGSNFIVVGRPIYKAASPAEAVQSIRKDLQ
ncbi:MAG: orotidine-5'-phosphate decarboxylase [Opitutaceae bacterium]|nr:orotidine-5'-phosphate decarboxylase [Opitutaceae bacterium]|tara:strand:+ start:4401 stop:5093 length:693 start_codon:yes stop_codon:yes gene_type:complete